MSRENAGAATKPAALTPRTLIVVWICLLALTALTVSMASLRLGRLSIVAVLAVAAAKSSLVLAYFMHLRYEKVRLYLGFFLISAAALAIFLGLTLTDILAR